MLTGQFLELSKQIANPTPGFEQFKTVECDAGSSSSPAQLAGKLLITFMNTGTAWLVCSVQYVSGTFSTNAGKFYFDAPEGMEVQTVWGANVQWLPDATANYAETGMANISHVTATRYSIATRRIFAESVGDHIPLNWTAKSRLYIYTDKGTVQDDNRNWVLRSWDKWSEIGYAPVYGSVENDAHSFSSTNATSYIYSAHMNMFQHPLRSLNGGFKSTPLSQDSEFFFYCIGSTSDVFLVKYRAFETVGASASDSPVLPITAMFKCANKVILDGHTLTPGHHVLLVKCDISSSSQVQNQVMTPAMLYISDVADVTDLNELGLSCTAIDATTSQNHALAFSFKDWSGSKLTGLYGMYRVICID